MKFLQEITWQEVFDGWRKREASSPGWIEVATKVKGWPDWESWRLFTAEQLNLPNRSWKLYRFEDPLKEVSEMRLGPYSGWQSRVPERHTYTFKQLLELPKEYSEWSEHEGLKKIRSGLPFETQLIALQSQEGNLICIDGHHRAVAMSLAGKDKATIDFSDTPITIAIATLDANEEDLLNDVLERGTSKN